MNDLDRLLLQSQANFSLLLCFVLTIGIVTCAIGSMFFNLLKHNLEGGDWLRFVAIGFEYFTWGLLILCIILDVLSLMNVFKMYGG